MIVIILSKGRQDSVSVKMRQNIVNSPQISHNSEENTPYIKNLTPPVLMNAREKMTEKYKKSPAKIWVLFFRDLLLCITTRTFRLSFEELDHVFCIFSPTLWILHHGISMKMSYRYEAIDNQRGSTPTRKGNHNQFTKLKYSQR